MNSEKLREFEHHVSRAYNHLRQVKGLKAAQNRLRHALSQELFTEVEKQVNSHTEWNVKSALEDVKLASYIQP